MALLFCNPTSPYLIQRLGPRAVTLLGATVLGGGLVATSFVPSLPWAFLTFGVLVGLGGNFMYHTGIQVIFDWFPGGKSCARASSFVVTGTSFGKSHLNRHTFFTSMSARIKTGSRLAPFVLKKIRSLCVCLYRGSTRGAHSAVDIS